MSGGSFEKYWKTTRRAQFLSEMDCVVPWAALCAVVEAYYPKGSPTGGGPPLSLELMQRVYFLQQWFYLSGPYDSATMRSVAGVNLAAAPAPDETTICKFRHLLERHKLGEKLLSTVNGYLELQGTKIARGTIVDATIISAPSSTKNKKGERDPQRHWTAKGGQYTSG